MKRFSIIACLLILLFNCTEKSTTRNIESVVINDFFKDSTSIRAIKTLHKDTLFYAGSNGKVGMTLNGGKNWSQIIIKDSLNNTPHFRSITYNNKALFVLSIGNPALLYKIPLENNSNLHYQLVYKEEHEKVFYDSMHFFDDALHGIAVGDPTEDCPSIIMTKDGGNTWEKTSCNSLPKFVEGEAFFAASNTNIEILGSTVWIGSGGKKSRILKSIDKGETWNIYDTPIVQGNGPQGIYSVDFFNSKEGIAIGGDFSKPDDNCKNKIITNDGGQTWQVIADNENPNYKSCVQYVPNSNGKEVFAVGKTGISFSKNGGKNWKQVSDKSFYSIQFVDSNTAWLSGNNKISKMTIQ